MSIGHPAHGRGQLAPDSPRFICSTCHNPFWNASDLNEDGDCTGCVKALTCDCGNKKEEDHKICAECESEDPGTDYPTIITTSRRAEAEMELARSLNHGLNVVFNL